MKFHTQLRVLLQPLDIMNPSPKPPTLETNHPAVTQERGALTAPASQNESALAVSPRSDLVFDQPVILRQSSWVPQFVVWTIVGVTSFTIAWACIMKVDEAVPAQGKLEPRGAVKEVQAPVGGVVRTIEIEEGEMVNEGDLLIQFDQTTAQAQQESLEQIRKSLVEENRFYQSLMESGANVNPLYSNFQNTAFQIEPQLESLNQNRAALAAENQLYRAMLGDTRVYLTPAQQQRLDAASAEFNSRVAAAELEVSQLSRQLNQVQVQLESNEEILALNQQILDDITPLMEEGGLARIQFLRQQQEVETLVGEIQRLLEEEQRLKLAIVQAQERKQNTMAVSEDDLLTRIAQNEKQIAEIDSQFSKVIVENEKRIQEIDSQLSQARQTLLYQELRAPVQGTVFDLQPTGPGFVANTTEPILKIVPVEGLVARVFITNRDIGFINPGDPVDVRIDSFPYSEFGDVKGSLIKVGSDALPPDEIYPFYRFPAEVSLDQQYLMISGKEIVLQSGMSVSVNIKTRKRRVITFLTDLFVRKLDVIRSGG